MTTEKTIEIISTILNNSGAHEQLSEVFTFLGLTETECEELAVEIEKMIQELAMNKWNSPIRDNV
jgi:hypothetical protein